MAGLGWGSLWLTGASKPWRANSFRARGGPLAPSTSGSGCRGPSV